MFRAVCSLPMNPLEISSIFREVILKISEATSSVAEVLLRLKQTGDGN